MPRTRSPFVIGVTEELRHHGVQRAVRVAAPLPGLAVSTARVVDGADIEVDVVVESTVDGRLTATGTVRAPWVGDCRRCLRPVEGVAEVDVLDVFEHDPTEGETYPLDSDVVDLEPLVRENVLLALPLAPLCAEDCAGPDPEAHPVVVGDPPPAPDPRWAALDELRLPEE